MYVDAYETLSSLMKVLTTSRYVCNRSLFVIFNSTLIRQSEVIIVVCVDVVN